MSTSITAVVYAAKRSSRPCYHCQVRHPACHAHCRAYADDIAAQKEHRAKILKAADKELAPIKVLDSAHREYKNSRRAQAKKPRTGKVGLNG